MKGKISKPVIFSELAEGVIGRLLCFPNSDLAELVPQLCQSILQNFKYTIKMRGERMQRWAKEKTECINEEQRIDERKKEKR